MPQPTLSHTHAIVTHHGQVRTDDGYCLQWQLDEPKNSKALIVLVHGLGEHRGRFNEVVQQLNEADFAVFRYDQRGHGESNGKRGHSSSFQALVDDLEAMHQAAVQRVPDVKTFFYGQSFGGAVVLRCLLQRTPEVVGAIVTSPLIRPVNSPGPIKYRCGLIAAKLVPKLTFSIGVRVEQLTHDRTRMSHYQHDPFCHRRVSARLGRDMLQNGDWILDHADQLTYPVLLMHGDQDHVTSYDASRRFAEAAQLNCEFVTWSEQYHELHHDDKRQEVIDSIVAWIARHC